MEVKAPDKERPTNTEGSLFDPKRDSSILGHYDRATATTVVL